MREKGTYARYLRQVERRLRCAKAERKRLLAGLESELNEAAAQMPELTMAQLEERFGRPQTVAAELEEALEPGVVIAHEKSQNQLKRVLAALLALALLLSAFWYVKYRQALEITNKMYVVVGPAREVTDSEYDQIFGLTEGTNEP